TRPIILYTHYHDELWPLLESLRHQQLHCLICCYWSLTVADQQEIALRIKQWGNDHPRHHIEHMAPSIAELEVLQYLKVPGFLCHQNSLIDEQVFRILPQEPKRFKAIYDARLTPFKRHQLAAQIEDL